MNKDQDGHQKKKKKTLFELFKESSEIYHIILGNVSTLCPLISLKAKFCVGEKQTKT